MKVSIIKTAGVICEFNPFHNGHKFLLENIKSEYADKIVCIMSGSFVQRGDVSICDKFTKTKIALKNGADVVIELPTPYAVSSAETFAKNGVRIAKECGCDMLCFGCESADTDTLKDLAKKRKSEKVKRLVLSFMKSGDYYPRALFNSVLELYGEKYAEILKLPNNILAIEYINACEKYDISPIAIERKGAMHHSKSESENIASGSYIRSLIENHEEYSHLVPSIISNPAHLSNIESAILYRLKTMSKDEIKKLPDVSEGLENRIFECAKNYNSLQEILDNIKTKRYTLSRLRRIVISALLGITKDIQNTSLPYLRVLGFRENSQSMLRFDTALPVITTVKASYNELNTDAKRVFDTDIKATDIQKMCSQNPEIIKSDFTNGIIKI